MDEAVPVENRAADRTRRYEIDPADYLAAIKRCRGTEAIVIGGYHSHPSSEPTPSETDRAAAFSDFVYVISGRGRGREGFVTRAYRLRERNFSPVSLVLDAEEQCT